jgi:FkbH-like protein
MKEFGLLKKNLKKDVSGFKKIKVALLGDTATQFLGIALKGVAVDSEINIELFEADFNQIERQVFDGSSELYQFNPEIVIIFQSSHKLLSKYNKLDQKAHNSFAANELELIENLSSNLTDKLNAKTIFYNYSEIDDAIFGNFSNKIESSFLFQLRKLNFELMNFAANRNDVLICDLSSIQNQVGKERFFQSSIYINTEMVLSIDVLPLVASRTFDIIKSLQGKIKKCVILDLDNTTWGGIIGDDGIENIQIGSLGIGKAFTEFQYWVKKLKRRGIIVAVCSKNDDEVAREPFIKHPEMVLRLDDISVFVANWENKANNIAQIQSILNIGFDSMVFLDDNPFERNMVRENIPEITVPELPEDPADYLEFLYSLNLFETTSFSNEDNKRTKLYQIEAERVSTKKKFANEDDFLKNLKMISEVEAFNRFNTPRVAQLSQRSNQFNLRTIRYSESDIEKLSNSEDYFTFAFSLEDRFGDNGLICVLVLQKLNREVVFIESWFMSCRVLKRDMENFVLNTIVDFAKGKGFKIIQGEYLQTEKNSMVKDHYANLGFVENENKWELTLSDYEHKKCFINPKYNYGDK